MNILFAASEAYPLVKTGGLGDVIYSLPKALQSQGESVKVVLPAYRTVLEQLRRFRILGWMDVEGANQYWHKIRILEAEESALGVPLILVDAPHLFDRPGNPYLAENGHNWHDNAERFTVFSKAVAYLNDGLILGWKPDVIHCHDWQTGLVPAFLSQLPDPAPSIYTIHNLSYAGVFSYDEFKSLNLPAEWWSSESLEFYGNFSMLKAGIVFAHHITTVSPTYAREIQTPTYGYGFDGVLRNMSYKLSGILNGIDQDIWNPRTDPLIPHHYDEHHPLEGKRQNKIELMNGFNCAHNVDQPLIGFIGRLVEQKGIDLLLEIMPQIMDQYGVCFVILGSGELHYEYMLKEMAALYPDQLLLKIGYSEEMAHQIEAAADLFAMPSRFEPCGLNQMYSLRYGTPPVVHRVGGLADTVVDTHEQSLADGTATGFVFDEVAPHSLCNALQRALELYQNKEAWLRLVQQAMHQDFSWQHSAQAYRQLYQSVVSA